MNGSSRVLITKHVRQNCWRGISNPSWGPIEIACHHVLMSQANAYVEYENCGMQTRMIRFEDIGDYGLYVNDVIPMEDAQFGSTKATSTRCGDAAAAARERVPTIVRTAFNTPEPPVLGVGTPAKQEGCFN